MRLDRLLFPTLLLVTASCHHRPPTATPTAFIESSEAVRTLAEIGDLAIQPLPRWTVKYPKYGDGDARRFNQTKLRERFGLSRLEAVELQNMYRDRSRAEPNGDRVAQWNETLAEIRRGELESGIDREVLDRARFIAVFDLDDTMLDQYYESGEKCHSIAIINSAGETRYVQLTPGWRPLFEGVHRLGGAVVLFSANLDHIIGEIAESWLVDGTPIAESGLIDGILTNGHLVLQEATEGPGKENRRRGKPITKAFKDVRIFDPTLERVVIVDDNPLRIFQFGNARVYKKFAADPWCNSTDADERRMFESGLPTILTELEDAVRWLDSADGKGATFQRAYLPYSTRGQLAVAQLVAGLDWDRKRAIAHVRKHPDLARETF